MSKRRVVVTGLGIVSPMGSTVATAWDGIVNGRSGVGLITRMDVSAFPVRIGGEVSGFTAEDYMSPKDVRKFDPFVPYGFASAVQAMRDSGFEVTEANSPRIGVAIGAGIGGLEHDRGEHGEVARSRSRRARFPRSSSRAASSMRPRARSRSTSACAGRTSRS